MKKTLIMLAGTVLLSSGLAACTETGQLDPNSTGTVLGGVAGGFLGSQFGEGSGKVAASVAGALLGAWAGNKIVQGMTAKDRSYYGNAASEAYTAPAGQTITWYNPDSGNQGTITPMRNGRNSSGELCREYQQTITVGGRTQRAYGTACRQADGSWKIVS